MAKFQSPLLGYNNNVRHKNRVFHIQTEDSGVNHPHIITHLFMDGGRILKSVKKSYAEHVGAEGMSETVRVLMKEQHKAMFIALRDGQFDHLVDGGPAPAAAPPAATARDAAAAAPPAPSPSSQLGPPTHPEPPRAEPAEDNPAPRKSIRPPASEEAPVSVRELARVPSAPRIVLAESDPEDVPVTTRQPPNQRPDAKPGHELTLDFDALERAAHDVTAPSVPSLFHSSDLPPPPKTLFAKEPGTGGKYRAVEPAARSEPPPPSSRAGRDAPPASRRDPREEPQPSRPPPSRSQPVGAKSPAGKGSGGRAPSRPAEARYAPARPAAIFGSTQPKPPPSSQSIFGDELISDKSLDEVILSYLAEDLEPPRRK